MTPTRHTIVQISEKRDKKQITKLHAAAGTVTLCDIRKHYSRVVKWIPLEHQIGVKKLEDPMLDEAVATVPIFAPQPWPKHWPSTRIDRDVTIDQNPPLVDPCHACKKAAEAIWRIPKSETDADLTLAAATLKPLANLINTVLTEAHDELGALGFPTHNEQGAGGTADQTAQFVARARQLDEWIEQTTLLKARILTDVKHLELLIVARTGKEIAPKRSTCGQSQTVMDETPDWPDRNNDCGGLAEGELGMCDKHRVSYSRHLRKKEAA